MKGYLVFECKKCRSEEELKPIPVLCGILPIRTSNTLKKV